MPYVNPTTKAEIGFGRAPQTVGELTYCLTREIIRFLEHKTSEEGLHYQALAESLGALEGAKLDLTMRLIEPYEETARHRNGDVWPDRLLEAVRGHA
jgi:hypothetical protein